MGSYRFCMITTFYPPYAFGGDALFVQRLANGLARRGHQIDVIHCHDSYHALARTPPLAGHRNEPGVTVHGLASGVGLLSPLATHQTGYPLFKAREIRRILAAKRFDVTHFHNISLVGGPMVLAYGQGVKLYTLHDHWLVCPTHVLFKFRREACVKPSCLRCTLVHRRPPQLWRYTRLLPAALRHVDAFIAPSEFVLRRHQAAGLQIPIVHIPPFVEAADEEPPAGEDAGGLLPDGPFFLFVGRLEKLKGLQTVIPLFRTYRDAGLVVAGDGDYAGELRRLAAGCERVHFVGRLAAPDLRRLYARAIALIVPSITFETFGQVVVEAFAARTPAIVRDLGALPEIVRASGGGLVYRGDGELLDHLARLQADRVLRERFGEAGYRAYRARWSEDVHLDRYLELVEELRAGRRIPVLPGPRGDDDARSTIDDGEAG